MEYSSIDIYTLSLHDALPISPDDAVLCFERHATSKIRTADDLIKLSTMGFRGEALAAIASVGKVDLDRKSIRLNSSHPFTSYAVFCLKKKTTNIMLQ